MSKSKKCLACKKKGLKKEMDRVAKGWWICEPCNKVICNKANELVREIERKLK